MRVVRLERKYETLIEDNNEAILDTRTMLMDWFDSQPISNSEKREKLRNAAIAVRGDIWKGWSRSVPPSKSPGGGGGGYSLCKAIRGCAALVGHFFEKIP